MCPFVVQKSYLRNTYIHIHTYIHFASYRHNSRPVYELSWNSNKAFLLAAAFSLGGQFLVIYFPPLQKVLFYVCMYVCIWHVCMYSMYVSADVYGMYKYVCMCVLFCQASTYIHTYITILYYSSTYPRYSARWPCLRKTSSSWCVSPAP